MLTAEKWESADLGRLVQDALSLHNALAQRCGWDGEPVRVVPRCALALSMMMHELATNAAKYGALSNEAGSVTVSWAASDAVGASPDAMQRLRLRWQEAGGPPVLPPTRRGFGTRMIERGVVNELGGEVRIIYEPDGLVCTLDIPLEPS